MSRDDGKIKIGIVTGKKAFPFIAEVAKEIEKKEPVDFVLVSLDIGVISFVTADLVRSSLERNPNLISALKDCDFVLVPGTLKGDAGKIGELLGIPVYKAGVQPSSLPRVIKALLMGQELSPIEPADSLLKLKDESVLRSVLEDVYLNSKKSFNIGDLGIPERPPPIVIAAETPVTLPIEELESHARYLEESGAEIVVAGIPFGESLEEGRKRIAAVARGLNSAVLGVDSANPKILIEGASMGAELLLSLSLGNMDALSGVKEEAFVVIPGDPIRGDVPKSVYEVASSLSRTISIAREKGFKKLIADPILYPPGLGFADSLNSYRLVSSHLPNTPLFAGLSNVVELFDADSPGLVALLVQLLGEIGVSVMLTSEESWKAKGSTLEARGASLLTSYSLKTRAPPHNAGIDLLFLKEKEPPLNFYLPEGSIVEKVLEEPEAEIQRGLFFTVGADHAKKTIVACAHRAEGITCFEGSSARSIYKKILSTIKEVSPEHAAYLGYELSRAEISLILGKTYIQDGDILRSLVNKKDNILSIYDQLKRKVTGNE
ncbi:MAG: dihydropteroate synthase-like protein [Fervidicoccaceae archaeon]